MKYIEISYGIILVLNAITCHVIDHQKRLEFSGTTQIPSENDTVKSYLKDSIGKKHDNLQKVSEGQKSVYLDDVLFTLKNQKWSVEEKLCLDHIYRLVYNLQNFTLWAVWDWDALSSEPQGILFGNRYQFGNFDQCMKAPWSTTHPHLKTKYCLAEVFLERTDGAVRRRAEEPFDPYQSALDFIEYRPPHTRPLNELTWGACVPSTCHPRTVERLLQIVLARSHLGSANMKSNISITEECQVSEDQITYDGLFYAFFIVVGLIASICLICTYLNNRSPETNKNPFIEACCLKENAFQLLKMKKEGIEVFYGIRYLTICLIVLDHRVGMYNGGPISDGITADQRAQSPLGLLLIHDDLFVDTFFMLSGFLTITNLLKYDKVHYVIILRRYVRLVVAFAVVIFYVSAVFPYSGSGPLWTRTIAQETKQCRQNWWLNILMVSNYVDTNNICILTSWYIPCDFHFFVITVLIYGLYKQWRKLGITVAALLTIGAIVVPGVLNYIYQLSPVQLFTFEFISNPLGQEDFHLVYIKSHTRYAAYLVGFYSGWFYVKYSSNRNLNKIKQVWSILGTCSALVLMLVIMIIGSKFLWRDYNPIEGAVYAALNRPVWALGVVIVVFCCSFGHVPIVKSFLSWYPWVPLSRLAYGLYLTHPILITHNVYTTRNPQHNDYFEILTSSAGIIFWGSVAALLLFLFFEAPVNNLFYLCIKPKSKVMPISNEELNPANETATRNATPIPTSSTGYLHNNLPPNIQYSSKI